MSTAYFFATNAQKLRDWQLFAFFFFGFEWQNEIMVNEVMKNLPSNLLNAFLTTYIFLCFWFLWQNCCVASLSMLYKFMKSKATLSLVFEYGFERYKLLKWGLELVCLKLIVIPSVFGLNQICGVLSGLNENTHAESKGSSDEYFISWLHFKG